MPIELLQASVWSAYDLAIEAGQRYRPPPECVSLSHPLLPGALRIEQTQPRAYVHGFLMTLSDQLHAAMLQLAQQARA
jgi:hypothetical protein